MKKSKQFVLIQSDSSGCFEDICDCAIYGVFDSKNAAKQFQKDLMKNTSWIDDYGFDSPEEVDEDIFQIMEVKNKYQPIVI